MGIKETFKVLEVARTDFVVPAVTAALDQPDERIASAAAPSAVQHINTSMWQALLRNFTKLDTAAQDIVSRAIFRFHDQAKETVMHGQPEHRQLVLGMLEGSLSVDTVDLMIAFLSDDNVETRKRVDYMIREVIERFRHDYEEELEPVEDRGDVPVNRNFDRDLTLASRAIEKGMDTLPFHHSFVVIECALMCGEAGYGWICNALKRDGKVNSVKDVVIDELTKSDREVVYPFLFHLLKHTAAYFRRIATQILATKNRDISRRLVNAHLARWPRAEQAEVIRLNNGIPWLTVFEHHTDLFDEEYLRFLITQVEKLELDSTRKVPLWGILADTDVQDVSKRCLDALRNVRDKSVEPVLERLLDSQSPNVQLAVIQMLSDARHPRLHNLLAPKVTSPFAEVSQLASRLLGRVSFNRYLNSFDNLDEETRRVAGKAVLELDEEVMATLLSELRDVDPAKRLKAVRVIAATESQEQLQDAVLNLVNDPDKKIRATTIQLLSTMGNVKAMKALVRLLSDRDPRVQANAVEALEAIKRPEFRKVLVPFIKSPNNRTRGNAMKALWTLGVKDVSRFMWEMLESSNPKMRMSAAWVIAECNPDGGLPRLREAVGREANGSVKQRMQAALTRLEEVNNA